MGWLVKFLTLYGQRVARIGQTYLYGTRWVVFAASRLLYMKTVSTEINNKCLLAAVFDEKRPPVAGPVCFLFMSPGGMDRINIFFCTCACVYVCGDQFTIGFKDSLDVL